MTPEALAYIKGLQEDFYITYPDKAGQDFVLICKKHAIQIITNDFISNPTIYEKVDQNAFARPPKRDLRSPLGNFPILDSDPDNIKKIPIYVLSPKLHKVGNRFITKANKTYYKDICMRLTCFLNVFKIFAPDLWIHTQTSSRAFRNRLSEIGVKIDPSANSFFTKNSASAVRVIDRVNQLARGSIHRISDCATHDLERMFTNLPHDDITTQLTSLIGEIWAYCIRQKQGSRYIKIYKDGYFEWVPAAPNPPLNRDDKSDFTGVLPPHGQWWVYDMEGFREDLKYILEYSFVRFGGCIYRQRKGIPMGIDPSPDFSDLYLHSYEYKFLKQIISMAPVLHNSYLLEAIEFLHTTSRYQDDINTFRNTFFLDHQSVTTVSPRTQLRGVYPLDKLNLKVAHSGLPLIYLDMKIISELRNYIPANERPPYYYLASTLYDKRDSEAFLSKGFRPLRFPDIHSYLSETIKYSCFTSQFIRYSSYIRSYDDFIFRVASLIFELVHSKGYNLSRLLNALHKRCAYTYTNVSPICMHTSNLLHTGIRGFSTPRALYDDIYRILRSQIFYASYPQAAYIPYDFTLYQHPILFQ